jgi:hypothetical protein
MAMKVRLVSIEGAGVVDDAVQERVATERQKLTGAALFAASGWSAWLGSNGFYLGRELAQDQLLKLDLFARIIDVDAYKVPVGIIVHHNPFRNFSALDAWLFGEVDIQGVRVSVIIQSHSLKPRSGKALWIVTLSSNVMTRK